MNAALGYGLIGCGGFGRFCLGEYATMPELKCVAVADHDAALAQATAERFEKESPVMTETDRTRRQRELAELDRDFQRKQREFREDLNQRRNEEMQGLVERSNRIIRQIAEQEKFDLIVQEAVYFNPRIDITERVLRALNAAR